MRVAFHLVRVAALIVGAILFSFCLSVTAPAAKEPQDFDFGRIHLGDAPEHSFPLSNDGKKTLSFERARSSGDCLQVLSYPKKLAPREKGELKIRWVATKPGHASHEVSLYTDRPKSAPFRFVVTGTVVDPAEAKSQPAALNIPPHLIDRQIKKRDTSLLMSVESVLKKRVMGDSGTILVDVRNDKDFMVLRIPGSVNIPLFAVKTKHFLKSGTIVLVNEGFRWSRLEPECGLLREKGFKAFLLDGGLLNWRNKGGSLEGDAQAAKDLNKIPPGVFYEEKDYSNWIVLDATKLKKTEASRIFPYAIEAPGGAGAEKRLEAIESQLSKSGTDPLQAALFVDDDGKECRRLEELAGKNAIKNLFCLQGGMEAYGRFLEGQAALAQAEKGAGKKGGKCESCP